MIWDQSAALEAFGIDRDLLHAGVPIDGVQPLIEVMQANLSHLNELRAQVLGGAKIAATTMQVGRVDAVASYVCDSLAQNTRRAYLSDLSEFERWGGSIPRIRRNSRCVPGGPY